MEMLSPVVSDFAREWEGKDEPPLRCLLIGGSELAGRVKSFLNIRSTPSLAIVNLEGGEKYVPGGDEGGDVTAASARAFLHAYLKNNKIGLVKKALKA